MSLQRNIEQINTDAYNQCASIYDAVMGYDFAGLSVRRAASALEHMGINEKSPLRILDLGCGTGVFLEKMYATYRNAELFGIDISRGMYDEAVNRLKGADRVSLSVGSIVDAQYPKDCDLITINFDVINHINPFANWRTVFEKAYAALRPGGYLLFDMNTRDRILGQFSEPEIFTTPSVQYHGIGKKIHTQEDGIAQCDLVMDMTVAGSGHARVCIVESAPETDLVEYTLRRVGFENVHYENLYGIENKEHTFLRNRLFFQGHKPKREFIHTHINSENMERHAAYLRAKQATHNFFQTQGKVHLEFPFLAQSFEPTSSSKALPVVCNIGDIAAERYLLPWPDHYYMRLMAAGVDDFYFLQKTFRNSEPSDATHGIEFDMLEFYRVGGTYRQVVDETMDLIRSVVKAVPCELDGYDVSGYDVITLQEGFKKYTDFSDEAFWDHDLFVKEARGMGYAQSMGFRQIWHDVVDTIIEPQLGHNRPALLEKYPAYIDTEGIINSDGKTIARGELFIKGIEIGNAYTINTDGSHRGKMMRDTITERRRNGLDDYRYDYEMIDLLEKGQVPQHASMTVGLERLVMVLMKYESIHDMRIIQSV